MKTLLSFFVMACCLVAQANATETNVPAGIAVELTDAEDNPCTTGYVRAYPNPRPKDWEGNQPRNIELDGGKCFVPLSNFNEQKSFKIVLYADGFAPYEINWKDTAKEPLPETLTFKMPEKAAEPIGGRVIDEAGNPVANAVIEFGVSLAGRQKNPDGFTGIVARYAQWIKTDADGYWSYKVLPQEQFEQNFDMAIEHETFPRLRISRGQTFKEYAAKNAEGQFSKMTVLPQGLSLKGKIVDEQGKPIAGVIVHCNAARQAHDAYSRDGATKSDEKGEFLFTNCSPKGELNTVDVGVCHQDFAPDVISLNEITPDMKSMNIVLKKGKKIIFKAVDIEGKPIEGVRIDSHYWKNFWGSATGTHQLFVGADESGRVFTGKDGRFVWENAPDNRFDFIFGNDKYQNVKIDYETLKYGDEENVYVFKPLFIVTGTVTDAETGKPIPSFNVSEWFSFKNSSGNLMREFGSQSGTEGKFTRKVGHRFGEFDNYYLRVEADGYEGLQSEDLITKPGDLLIEFKLKKAMGKFSVNLTGTVLQPDGTPAANIQIGVATPRQHLSVNGMALGYEGMPNKTKTDSAGKFTISKNTMSIGDQDYILFFLHDTGMLQIGKEDFEKHSGPLTLQKWSRIEGTVFAAGNKPLANVPIYCSSDRDFQAMQQQKKPSVMYFGGDDLRTDAEGHFSVRVFPGKGTISRATKYNNDKATALFHTKPFEIKPGETLKIDLGGSGYIVKGSLMLAVDQVPKPVDWKFAYVEARPFVPEYAATASLSKETLKLAEEIIAAIPEFRTIPDMPPTEFKCLVDRWAETPEGKAKIEENEELYEGLCRYWDFSRNFMHDYINKYNNSHKYRIVGTMDDKGNFQLDGLTPGNWRLSFVLNFSSVPGQWWDYAAVWQKETELFVPDVPAEAKVEELQIHPILFGYEESERHGTKR